MLECLPKCFRGGNSRHTRNMRLAHETHIEPLTGAYPGLRPDQSAGLGHGHQFVHGVYRCAALVKYALERARKQTLGV